MGGYDWGSKKENFQHHGPHGIPTYKLEDVTTPLCVLRNERLAGCRRGRVEDRERAAQHPPRHVAHDRAADMEPSRLPLGDRCRQVCVCGCVEAYGRMPN